jgi:hypothetical protein
VGKSSNGDDPIDVPISSTAAVAVVIVGDNMLSV